MASRILTDAKGRKLEIREVPPSLFMDIIEVVGSESAANGAYMRYANYIFSVESIDGVPLPTPKNQKTLKQNADKIGYEGLAAIFNDIAPQQKEGETEEEASAREENTRNAQEVEIAKN